MIPHIARRLKSEVPADGTVLKPSDYLPILKALDSSNSGTVDMKDVIILFDKHLKSNSSDCSLELRYIANFIEFKANNKNTRGFVESNSKLRGNGAKLLEVEVMSELNKMFLIPVSAANIIYKKLV